MTVGLTLLLAVALGAVALMQSRRLAEARAAAGAAATDVARLREDLDRSQQLLAQADRLSAIGMVAAGVTHEVRNPLVSVRTFVQLVPERLHDEEFRTTFRDLALAEIDRICTLMSDLLAFARPSAAEAEAARATDVNEILGQIERLLETEAKKRDIALRADLTIPLPAVPVDDVRVKQVFLNVLLNAIQACDRGGHVTVRSRLVRRHDADYVQVEVGDTGRGIPAEHMAHIFDPFFTTRESGSGLGLFIARRIVTDHGGFIDVTSTPGSGSAFSIHFPLPPAYVHPPAQPPVRVAGDGREPAPRPLQTRC
jgi:signal transduction histidine kinase